MNVGSAKSPIEFFKIIFNMTFMNLLVSCINMNAIEIVTTRSRNASEFKPTDVEEVSTLLAVYFFMGYIKVNEMESYWNSHSLYNLKFENYISKERFFLLMRALAFKKKIIYDDHGDSRRSWYDAAKPIANYFNSVMKKLVVPSKELNIDKSTVHWFNELNCMRRKPELIRMHLLSDKNGVFQRVYLCHPDGKNKGDEVVRFLMKDFLGSGYSLYSCPFYTSVSLAEELLQNKTYMTGILKRKRSRNPAFVKNKLKTGQIKALYNGNGVCVCNTRKSNRTILALSTEHGATLDTSTRLPSIVSQFKKHTMKMFKRNQTLTDNSPCGATKFNRNVMYLLQVMLMNTFSLYNANNAEKLSFCDFRKAILYEILPLPSDPNYADSDEDTDASVESNDRVDPGEVIHLPSELSKGKRKVRNCRNCWLKHGIRKRTHFNCLQCSQKWGLCIGECFREFHDY